MVKEKTCQSHLIKNVPVFRLTIKESDFHKCVYLNLVIYGAVGDLK
jgi:hypothetical protein